jgi:predicted outer membrane protein
LKIRARTANQKELEAIDLEMDRLALENPKAFSEAMLDAANQTSVALDELILKDKLEKILPIISVSYLSKNYFKKTPQWFYQRLNGNLVNGKEARFTVSEVQILSNALKEIGQKLSTSANLIL